MREERWVRVAAVAGVLFAVLIVVAGPILSRSSPALSASNEQIFAFFRSHRAHLQLSAALGALAAATLVIWLSGLFGFVRRASGGYPGPAIAAVAGGVLAAAIGLASAAIKAATACQIDAIGPGSARIFYTLVRFTNGGVLFGLAVVIAVTAVATVASPLAGRWFVLIGAILAIGSLLGAASISSANDTAQAIGKLFLTLDTFWVVVISVLLWRRPGVAEASPAP